MNHIIKYSILILLCAASYLCLPACKKNDEKKAPDLKILQAIAEENHVAGMTALGYRDGAVRFVYNYGYSDIERKTKVDENTIFFVASISKTITGIALMKLLESGDIKSIEDDISPYIGYTARNPEYPEIPVTIRHLMTHTSGISDGGITGKFVTASYSRNPPSMQELLSPGGSYYNPDIWLNAMPGSRFKYSNLGAVLAAAIVAKLSGKRFDEYVNEKILKPICMLGGFTVQNVKDSGKVAVLYRLDDNRDPCKPPDNYNRNKYTAIDLSCYIPSINPAILGEFGGLKTNVHNLAKIMEIFIRGGVCNTGDSDARVLKKSTIDLMLKTHWEGWGFNGLYKQKGLFIHITEELIPGIRMYGHIGDAMGLLSAMYFNPQYKFGIIFIMNGGRQVKGESGFYRIEEQVFRESYRLLFN